jgi:hypothetical protein
VTTAGRRRRNKNDEKEFGEKEIVETAITEKGIEAWA